MLASLVDYHSFTRTYFVVLCRLSVVLRTVQCTEDNVNPSRTETSRHESLFFLFHQEKKHHENIDGPRHPSFIAVFLESPFKFVIKALTFLLYTKAMIACHICQQELTPKSCVVCGFTPFDLALSMVQEKLSALAQRHSNHCSLK